MDNNIEKTKSGNNTIKIAFIVISFIVAVFSAFRGYVVTTVEGEVLGLTSLTPFYLYTGCMFIAFYMAKKNKNIIANIMIIISILTYGWTFLFVQYLINKATDIHVIIHPYFYIYLSSAVFLLPALFFNDKKEVIKKVEETQEPPISSELAESLNKDNFVFAKFILGLKEIPYNTEALLVNNITDNTLDIIYVLDSNNQTIKIPISNLKSISSKPSMRMQSTAKKVDDNENKGILLSAVVFGGNPLLQLAGNSLFTNMLDGTTKNYEKVNYNTFYEITLEALINNEETKFMLSSDLNPDKFINLVNDLISKNN